MYFPNFCPCRGLGSGRNSFTFRVAFLSKLPHLLRGQIPQLQLLWPTKIISKKIMKNSEVNFQAPQFKEEFGSQHCSKGGVQGGIWLQLVSVAKDLTCCSGQCKLKSSSTVSYWSEILVFLVLIFLHQNNIPRLF